MVRRAILLSIPVLLGILYAIWQIGYHGVHPKLIFYPPPPEPTPLAALNHVISIELKDEAFDEIIARLEREQDVDILDLSPINYLDENWIKLRLKDTSFRSTLHHLYRIANDTDMMIEDVNGVVTVDTTKNWRKKQNNYKTKVYPIGPLLAGSSPIDSQQLAIALQSTLDPWSWMGHGGMGRIEAVPGAIVVSQTADLHRQIPPLLDGLARDPEIRNELIVDVQSLENRERINAALDEPFDFDFAGKTLGEIRAEIAKQFDISVVLCGESRWARVNGVTPKGYDKLNDIYGVDDKWFVSTRWKNVSLRSAIELISPSLTYAIHDGALLIGDPDDVERMSLRVYPVGDFLKHPAFPKEGDFDEFIVESATSWLWTEAGGNAELNVCGDLLFVWQSDFGHRKLKQFLAEQRRALFPLHHYLSPPAKSPIEAALARKVSFELDDVELVDVLRKIAAEQNISVWIDGSAMEMIASATGPDPFSNDEGNGENEMPCDVDPFGDPPADDLFGSARLDASVDDEEDPFADAPGGPTKSDKILPVTLHTQNVPLELALEWMLDSFHFTFFIDHESIVVVTDEVAEARLETKTYSIERLWDEEPWPMISSRFCDLVRNSIEPSSWDEVGGPGTIKSRGRWVTVSQVRKLHHEVERLIEQINAQFDDIESTKPVWIEPFRGDWNARVDQVLDKPCPEDFQCPTLKDFTRLINEKTGITATIHEDCWSYATKLQTPIDFSREDSSTLREAIRKVLAQCELECAVEYGRLRIVPEQQAESYPRNRIYPVADLAGSRSFHDEVKLARAMENSLNWELMYDSQFFMTFYVIHPMPGMIVVTQPKLSQHRTIERFISGVRQLASSSTPQDEPNKKVVSLDFRELLDSTDLETAKFINLYDVSDLHEPAEIQPLAKQLADDPFEIEDKDTYAVQPRKPSSKFQEMLMRCVFIDTSIRHALTFETFDDVLITTGENFEDIDWVLERLRTNLARPAAKTFSPSSKPINVDLVWNDATAELQVFDLRPILNEHDLTAAQIVELVETAVAPLEWYLPETMSNFGFRWNGSTHGFGGGFFQVQDELLQKSPVRRSRRIAFSGVADLKGQLVVLAPTDVIADVEQLLNFVSEHASDWPSPADIKSQGTKEIEQLLERLRTAAAESSPIEKRYAYWLMSLADKPSQRAVDHLVEMYAKTSFAEEPELANVLLRAIANCGERADHAIPLLEADLELDSNVEHHRIYFHTLAQLGDRGMNSVCQTLGVAGQFEQNTICNVLARLGDRAIPALDSLLC